MKENVDEDQKKMDTEIRTVLPLKGELKLWNETHAFVISYGEREAEIWKNRVFMLALMNQRDRKKKKKRGNFVYLKDRKEGNGKTFKHGNRHEISWS